MINNIKENIIIDKYNNKYKEYIYNNNLNSGLKIYTEVFTKEELLSIENFINDTYDWNFTNDKYTYHYPKYSFTNNTYNIKYGLCERKPINYLCDKCYCNMNIITKNNKFIPDYIQKFIIKKLVEKNIIPNEWVNNITVILYNNPKLISHFDSAHNFELPIINLRLFNDTYLTINDTIKILHKRGELSVLNGDFATLYTHGIEKYINSKTVSIVIRRIHPQLLSNDWIYNNCKKF